MVSDLLEVYKEALCIGTLYRELNTKILCLISKEGPKTNLKNWRTITLLGIIYKFMTNIMARRIKALLDGLIKSN